VKSAVAAWWYLCNVKDSLISFYNVMFSVFGSVQAKKIAYVFVGLSIAVLIVTLFVTDKI